MNKPTRQLATLIILMFIALMAAATWIQFFRASDLAEDERNIRTLYNEYGVERGKILVGGEVIASSTPVDDGIYKFQRVYESPELYAHITGYFSVPFNSMTGLERAENSVLGGSSSQLASQRLQELIMGVQPKGGSVELTIDPTLQAAALQALDGQKGAVAAINPKTGAILALVSVPSFDTNAIASNDNEIAKAAWTQLEEDPNKPLYNRAIAGNQYPPGSVFKVVTTAALLDNDPALRPDTIIDAPDSWTPPDTNKVIHNYGESKCGDGSGKVTLNTAFIESCNTPFAMMSVDLGGEKLVEQAKRFGFEDQINIPLEVTPSRFPMPTSDAPLAMDSIGQHDVMVTPLQMAMVAAAVANDGTLMTPYLVERTYTADLELVSQTEPTIYSQAISTPAASKLQEMMVNDVRSGTGKKAAISGIQVAGKTGTAETGATNAPHTWFIAYAPADDPQIALAVVVENAGRAGRNGTGGS
ncbi:MAG: penicillin-binding protein 2, partial [Actinomycetaceae bacterium]|nr:penicillin-binding protein 2 [Actinomycetaceae bacterium]